MIEIGNFPCVPGRKEGQVYFQCVFQVCFMSGYRSATNQVLHHWPPVGLHYQNVCMHTQESPVHHYGALWFLGGGSSQHLFNQVYLPQLLWTRKATLILSKLFFSLLCIHRFSLTHSYTCVNRHREVYAQAIWSGSLGMAQRMKDTRYQVFHWVSCSPSLGYLLVSWFLGRSCVLSRIQVLLQGDSLASTLCFLSASFLLVWVLWSIRKRQDRSVFWALVAILLSEHTVSCL